MSTFLGYFCLGYAFMTMVIVLMAKGSPDTNLKLNTNIALYVIAAAICFK